MSAFATGVVGIAADDERIIRMRFPPSRRDRGLNSFLDI
jgi:hypothetical protein